MVELLTWGIVIFFLAVSQFIAMLMVRRFDKFCNKIKAKFAPRPQAPETEVKKTSTVIMEDISSDIPHSDDI